MRDMNAKIEALRAELIVAIRGGHAMIDVNLDVLACLFALSESASEGLLKSLFASRSEMRAERDEAIQACELMRQELSYDRAWTKGEIAVHAAVEK